MEVSLVLYDYENSILPPTLFYYRTKWKNLIVTLKEKREVSFFFFFYLRLRLNGR